MYHISKNTEKAANISVINALMMFLLAVAFSFLGLTHLNAQIVEPVKFTVTTERVSDDEIKVIFNGKIDDGWHVYSSDIPKDGPTAATFHVEKSKNIEPAGKLVPSGGAVRKFDEMFGMEL